MTTDCGFVAIVIFGLLDLSYLLIMIWYMLFRYHPENEFEPGQYIEDTYSVCPDCGSTDYMELDQYDPINYVGDDRFSCLACSAVFYEPDFKTEWYRRSPNGGFFYDKVVNEESIFDIDPEEEF